ncbi:hypothetical protein P152DRAFT_370274, partial [Eremomyces bilateralis CBS 781.70]
PRLAIFGATGGCANGTLALALKEGYICTALVRNPTKLNTILFENHQIDAATYIASGALTVVEGSISKQEDILSTIRNGNSPPADHIVFGLGGAPSLQWSIITPVTMHHPTICEDATKAILAAIATVRGTTPSYRPVLSWISTTGTSSRRDVPMLIYHLYHWMLQVPHADKRKMEALIFDNQPTEGKGHAYEFVIIRPTLLTDGNYKGLDKVNVGWENPDQTGDGPAMGYSISRKDVGQWIFETIVKDGKKGQYNNKCVTLT